MKSKDEIRREMWDIIDKNPTAFPEPAHGIPNFVGLDDAAGRLRDLPEWAAAKVIETGFSPPMRAVRELALKEGKIVYVRTPTLAEEKCYVEVNPNFFKDREEYASSIKAVYICGQQVGPWEMRQIDLCVFPAVAVNVKGLKIGKGSGMADLGYAINKMHGIVSDETKIVTIVHSLQVVPYDIPGGRHDIASDYIITPEKIIKTEGNYPRPKDIYWEDLREEYKTLPVIKRLKKRLNWVTSWESIFHIDQQVSKRSPV